MKIKNKIILCVCSFILMICTMFSFVPLTKSDNLVVKADVVNSQPDTTFIGSNVISPISFNRSLSANLIGFPNFSDSNHGFTYSATNDTFLVNGTNDFTNGGYAIKFPSYEVSLSAGNYYFSYNIDYHYSEDHIYFGFHYLRSNGTEGYFDFNILDYQSYKQGAFTLDSDVVAIYLKLWVRVYDTNVVFDNFKIYNIMLTQDSSYPDYVPFSNISSLSFQADLDNFSYVENGSVVNYKNNIDTSNYNVYSNGYYFYNSLNYSIEASLLVQPYNFSFDLFAFKRIDIYPRLSDGSINSNLSTSLCFFSCWIGDYVQGKWFDGNISYIVYGSSLNSVSFFANRTSELNSRLNTEFGYIGYNFVAYVTSDGFYNAIIFPLNSNFNEDYFTLRTYYLNDELTDSEIYNNGYNNGFGIGYASGSQSNNAYDSGYKAGYNVGHNIGYNNGFSDGVEDSNQYTFLNLISATIDAPITYFQKLFNFELLGVNLQGFLTGLFTLCVIVTVIKLCLGG